MTIKDKVKGFLTFLDTDDANELEEVEELGIQETRRQDEIAFERVRPVSRPLSQEVPLTEAKAKRTNINNDYDNTSSYSTRANQPIQHRREEMAQQQGDNRVVIALKYPKRYEDARAIVDLLIENESVLIDFQYMMDAQARRCIDFIDGASRVLFGGLQKVGNTMYLLTPANVIVNIDELAMPNQHQDASFDYDLKRR